MAPLADGKASPISDPTASDPAERTGATPPGDSAPPAAPADPAAPVDPAAPADPVVPPDPGVPAGPTGDGEPSLESIPDLEPGPPFTPVSTTLDPDVRPSVPVVLADILPEVAAEETPVPPPAPKRRPGPKRGESESLAAAPRAGATAVAAPRPGSLPVGSQSAVVTRSLPAERSSQLAAAPVAEALPVAPAVTKEFRVNPLDPLGAAALVVVVGVLINAIRARRRSDWYWPA